MNSQLYCLAFFCAFLGLSSCGDYDHYEMYKKIYEEYETKIYGQNTERDLRRDLFKTYDRLVRPVKNPSKKITVSVGIDPLHIRDFDEKQQVLVLETFTKLNWSDDYLQWKPARYGNLSVFRVPSSEVWRPDITVYGSPEQSIMAPEPKVNVLLYNIGTVLWVPMFTIRSRCPLLKANKKIITCNIQFGSWSYDENTQDIDLISDKVDLTNFVDNNPDWKLVDVVTNRVAKHYPCCKEAYPVVNFNVTLQRRNRGENSLNGVLDEEDPSIFNMKSIASINLQDVLSDFTDADKLLKR